MLKTLILTKLTKKQELRFSVKNGDCLYRPWGICLTTTSGSLGTSYKDPRKNMFREINLTVGRWNKCFFMHWKQPNDS